MKKSMLAALLAVIAVPAAPALAAPPSWAPAHGWRDQSGHDRWEHSRRHAGYDRYGRYNQSRRLTSNDRVWRGEDGRYRCRRSDGTTGLVVGAVGGALVGRTIDTRGDRTMGTVLGGVGGALLGREIDRGGSRCR